VNRTVSSVNDQYLKNEDPIIQNDTKSCPTAKNDYICLPSPVGYVRKRFFNGDIDFDFACKMIKTRRETNSSCFFKYDVEDFKGDLAEKYTRSKSSFRGNDVYRARVWNRHKELLLFCELNNKISYIVPSEKGPICNILKGTLTVYPGSFDRDEYNAFRVNRFWDLFTKRIRNEYPGVVISKTLEVSTKKARGYIHINVILIFPNHSFPVYLHTSKKTKNSRGEYAKSWRLKDYNTKRWFGDMWDPGFVDIRAVKGPGDLAEYSLKYHIKYFQDPVSSKTQDLTLSTLSLYNKRAFSFPKSSLKRGSLSFCETVINYTVGLDNPNPVFFPRLDIIKHNSLDYKFLGHLVDYYGRFDPSIWHEDLDKPPDEFMTEDYIQKMIAEDYLRPTLSVWDSGSRLNDSGEYYNPGFKSPVYVHQKRFRTGTFYNKFKKVDYGQKKK